MRKAGGVATVFVFIFSIFFILVCGALSFGQLSEPLRTAVLINHAYDVNSNITYGVANNFELKLDVYHSREAKGPTPVVVMIHGGGWLVSNKDDYVLTAGPYLAMGFSVVNVEYRPGKISLAPASVEDCACALRWVGMPKTTTSISIK
jgi:acetyl esterase/lipase